MAKANSVPTATQAPITGASSNPSTRRRSTDRRAFIGGSDARIILGSDELRRSPPHWPKPRSNLPIRRSR